jgi:pimeloyl-ACP methyl ester carboxylesterase
MSADELFQAVADVQTDFRAWAEALSWMFEEELTEEDRKLLVSQRLALEANAAACSLISQSTCNYVDLIGTYELPTLCVWGDRDEALSMANVAWLAEHVPARSVMLQGAGHCSMWDQADRFDRALEEWIRSLG